MTWQAAAKASACQRSCARRLSLTSGSMKNSGPAETSREWAPVFAPAATSAAAWSAPPFMSTRHPQGSSTPATFDVEYTRSVGVSVLACAADGETPRLQDVQKAPTRTSPRTRAETSQDAGAAFMVGGR